MKHSFRIKKSQLRTVFTNKMEFQTLSIENKNDVENAINTLLIYTGLEDKLKPVNYYYNFLNNYVTFELELNAHLDKKDFFTSIKTFETFISID